MPQLIAQSTVGFAWRALCAAAALSSSAAEFPLQVKDMTLEEALALPGNSGQTILIRTGKPATLTNTPPAASTHRLFGAARGPAQKPQSADESTLHFCLDESKGTGTGYDRLILDLNRNGDLTDDPVLTRLPSTNTSAQAPLHFGPVQLPDTDRTGVWRPQFYAQMFLWPEALAPQAASSRQSAAPVGYLRLFAGRRLETVVEAGGAREKIALVDGNCNFKLGDAGQARLVTIRNNGTNNESWILSRPDPFLRAPAGAAAFARTRSRDVDGFSALAYFEGKPWTVELSTDCARLALAPSPLPTGELILPAHAVRVLLAREGPDGTWPVFTPSITSNRVVAPAGPCRLAGLTLGAPGASNAWQFMAASVQPGLLTVDSNKPARLEFGAPYTLTTTARKGQVRPGQESGMMSAVRSLFGALAGETKTVEMSVVLTGAGGETYSGFFADIPPFRPPRFEICDPAGKHVDEGSFEFG